MAFREFQRYTGYVLSDYCKDCPAFNNGKKESAGIIATGTMEDARQESIRELERQGTPGDTARHDVAFAMQRAEENARRLLPLTLVTVDGILQRAIEQRQRRVLCLMPHRGPCEREFIATPDWQQEEGAVGSEYFLS